MKMVGTVPILLETLSGITIHRLDRFIFDVLNRLRILDEIKNPRGSSGVFLVYVELLTSLWSRVG